MDDRKLVCLVQTSNVMGEKRGKKKRKLEMGPSQLLSMDATYYVTNLLLCFG